MKKTCLYLLLFFCFGAIKAQNTLKANEILNTKDFVIELSIPKETEVYSINSDTILELIKSSDKEYHIIYSFTTWCGPCREYLPMLLDYVETNNIELYIIIIEKDASEKLYNSKVFFDKMESFKKPLYCITSGKSKNPKKKYYEFVESIKPNHNEYGLSLNILFNNKGEVLYASTYNESKEEILKTLNQLIQ
ncbi:TlpA family protein disulfide reductase [Lacinutrix sp. MEBiC02404]